MSSSICPHFTQNAWKKDLCSNCFKSKDEHKAGNTTYKYTSAMDRSKFTTNLMSKPDLETKKTDYPNKYKSPTKSIMKKSFASLKTKTSKGKTHKVTFPKNISEVIGVGGEWSDNDSDDDDDHDFMNIGNERDDNAATSTDDEETLELKRITRANTDFNMNNGNLLGDPQENIKRSFAALKLGAPQVDKEGKKQTLKINVTPFGATGSTDSTKTATSSITATTAKAKFETKVSEPSEPTTVVKQCATIVKSIKKTTTSAATVTAIANPTKIITTTSTKAATSYMTASASSLLSPAQAKQEALAASDSDGKNSPPIERAMEKSLLDEISETLEKKQSECKKLASEKEASTASTTSSGSASAANATNGAVTATAAATAAPSKIKFEISSLSDAVENKPFPELKKPIARNPPITKDHAKPKINVFHKYSDSDSNCSDNENGISAYYDVVETQISYENLPDGKCDAQDKPSAANNGATTAAAAENKNSNNTSNKDDTSIFSSSQYITDMLLSSKTRAASYNLHEGNFMTSKITSDGLIVTKCSSDDALDSTGSSFDGSSDEETSYNMIRSESDSGIGISIGNEYKNNGVEKERVRVEKKLSVSTNNSDYEDIQVANQANTTTTAKTITKVTTTATPAATARTDFILEKSRELHGEPDGSADPDGSLENKGSNAAQQQQQLPALPKSPPPTKLIDARPSFLHGLQKQHPPVLLKKPDLPAKPVVSPTCTPLKTFVSKRTPTNAEQQVINQLHLVMSKSNENLNLGAVTPEALKDDAKLKKGRAPNPPPEQKTSAPPTPERDYNVGLEFEKARVTTADVAVEEKITKKVANTEQQSAPPTTPTQTETEKKANNEHSIDTKTSVDRLEADKSNVTSSQAASEQTATAIAATKAAASAAVTAVANANSIYARKIAPITTNVAHTNLTNGTKNTSSPVIREKDKRERATVNPKFRSLNTFVTQRSNALKNMQLQAATSSLSFKQSLTPEPLPKNHKNLSLSEECLPDVTQTNTTVNLPTLPPTSDKKLASQQQQQQPTPPQKAKTKFSIKKFLRMGASKTTDNLHKKDGIYSEICTGEEAGVVGKPRLVIIHPIDINPAAVEVVKDITKTSDAVAAQTIAVVTAKPPAPPLRNMDAQRTHELNKPARPPPPKSAELRRKQAIIGLNAVSMSVADSPVGRKAGGLSMCEAGGSIKSKSDNVYANLGKCIAHFYIN